MDARIRRIRAFLDAFCVGAISGTHHGELLGVAPSGRFVRWRQCHLLRVDEDGRAVQHDAIRDDLGLMRQLGAL